MVGSPSTYEKKFGITAGHVAMGDQKGRFESFPQIVPLVQPSEEDFESSGEVGGRLWTLVSYSATTCIAG